MTDELRRCGWSALVASVKVAEFAVGVVLEQERVYQFAECGAVAVGCEPVARHIEECRALLCGAINTMAL